MQGESQRKLRKSAQVSDKLESFAVGQRFKPGVEYFVNMIWISGRGPKEKRLDAVNFYDLHKWCFLLENKEQMKKIVSRLKQLGTGITHEIEKADIEISFQRNTTFKSDSEFNEWKLECQRVVEDILSDLHIVTIRCKSEDTKVFQKFLLEKFSSAIEIIVQNDSHGVCLVGDGESLVDIISEIDNLKCRYSIILETETSQEIGIRSIYLYDKQIKCWKLFDVKEKLKKKFPTVKIYECFEGKMLKIIGNADDVKQEEEFIKNSMWLYLYHNEELSFDKEVIEFLSRRAVKKFLDDEIKRVGTMGTWIVSFEKNLVEAYSVDDQKAKVVMKTISKSFHDHRYQLADTEKQKEKLQKIHERATLFEGLTNGKLAMHIRKTDKPVEEFRILCTTDLLNNTEVVNLLDEINHEEKKGAKASDVRLKLILSPERFHFIKKIEKEKILGLKKDVDLEFEKDNVLILKGDEHTVSVVKEYIDGLNLKQNSVFLPQSLTMHLDPAKLCEEHHCLLEKVQSNPESKVWFMNNIIIMVYLGEPRKDLWVDSQAVLRVSDEDIKDKSSSSTVLKDRKVVNITVPTSFMEKGKHSAHESFNDAYTKILKFKIRSVLMSLKIVGNWSTKKLVKTLVYPLTKLGSEEAITVILHSSDPNQCNTANRVIQVANGKEDNPMNKQQTLPDFIRGTGLEEMVVFGLEDDVKNVVEKLNQQMHSEAKLYSEPIKTNLTEPSKQEITNIKGTTSSEGSYNSLAMAREVKSQAQEVVVCNLCQEPVSFFCRRCGVNLCDQCALSHLRTKSKFGHDVVDFASKDDDDSFLCDSHPQHECSAYCKTCDVPICILCVSIKHKSHEISELHDKIEGLLKDIALENNRLQLFCGQLKNLLDHTTKQLSSLSSFYQDKKVEIRVHGEEWHRQIDNHVKKLHQELDDMKEEHEALLQRQKNEFEEMIEKIDEMKWTTAKLQNSKNVTNMQKFKSKIEVLETMKEFPQYTFPTFHASKIDEHHMQTFFGYIQKVQETKVCLPEKKFISNTDPGRKELKMQSLSSV
ncbi:uncharacterized protein LOC111132200 [Crassostrea virginica]